MDYDKRKNEIITELFKSKKLKIKIDSICFKKFITRNSKIAEDIEAEVFLQLSKYNSEKLVSEYDKNPNSIVAIAVQIAKYQFRYRKENPDSPNNSFGTKLLHTSTFQTAISISPSETFDDSGDDNRNIILYDEDLFQNLNYDVDKWELILSRLTKLEQEFIENLLAGIKPYKRKPTNEYKFFKEYVFNKIKNMDLNKILTPLELILTKLEKKEVEFFEIVYNDDLKYKEKIKLTGFGESKYISQRRLLLKKIKAMNIR